MKLLNQQGFSGVELNLETTERKTLSRLSKSLRKEGLQLAAIGTGLLYLRRGYSFTDRNAVRRKKAIASVKELIEFASGEQAIVIIGLIRGGDSVPAGAMGAFRKALIECDTFAAGRRGRLAVEAINRYETALLNTVGSVVELIRDAKLSVTGVLLDTFHMNIEEVSIESTIRANQDIIAHVHIADSNRLAPGRGHLDLETQLRLLDELGYSGWVSAETLAKPDNASAVVDTASFLKRYDFIQNQ